MNEEDRELFAELNNRYGDEEEKDPRSSTYRLRRSLFLKPTVFLVVIIFATLALGSFLKIFTLPSLDFLVESQRLSRDPMVKSLREAVVGIVATPEGIAYPVSRQQRGTGFNISAGGLIVTNRHLLEDAGSLTVSFPGRESCRVTGWSFSALADLGLINLAGENLPFVELEKEQQPEVGDKVLIIGNPLNYSNVVMCGEITGHIRIKDFSKPVLEIDAPIHGGSSGSPVFNEEGRVVAVIFAALESGSKGDVRGLALPVELLDGFLQECDNGDVSPVASSTGRGR